MRALWTRVAAVAALAKREADALLRDAQEREHRHRAFVAELRAARRAILYIAHEACPQLEKQSSYYAPLSSYSPYYGINRSVLSADKAMFVSHSQLKSITDFFDKRGKNK